MYVIIQILIYFYSFINLFIGFIIGMNLKKKATTIVKHNFILYEKKCSRD